VSVLKRAGSSFTGLAGKAKEFFGEKHDSSPMGGYGLAGIELFRGRQSFRSYDPEPVQQASPKLSSAVFDLGAILRLKSFLYLLALTGVFLFQISSTLAINDLAKRNERLREKLRISTSVTTAQELQVRQLQSIRNITGHAQALGLDASPVPPVELKP